ncbi:MAG: STT3 domain-containing protein [Thermodesulfobacteriota bacterium]
MSFSALSGRTWLRPLLFALLVYAATLAVRLGDLPKWDHDQLRVDGEYIMATHDAYAWLAGAYGVGTGAGTPLARMARAYADLTGRPAGEFAFFAPAVAGSLVAVAVLLWAWILGGLEAGLGAGLLAALAPGFYFRTRLGYYDTDIATLLFPVLLSWVVAYWLGPHLRQPLDLLRRRPESGDPAPVPLAWPLAAGLLARLCGRDWHTHLPDFALLVGGAALVLALVLGRQAVRPRLAWGVALFGLAGFFGNLGLGLAAFFRFGPRFAASALERLWPSLAVAALVLALAGLNPDLVNQALRKFQVYSKTATEVADAPANRSQTPVPGLQEGVPAGPPPVYPGITQSVVEAQNAPIGETLAQVTPRAWITLAGLAGFVLVVLARPTAVFLLPLGLLALLGHKLGVRMTMFGGPAAALGLLVPVAWGVRRLLAGLAWRNWAALLAATAVAGAVMGPTVRDYYRQPPTPIFTKPHAVALKALGQFSPADSMVWTWWDWGYATQYYARRMSFADGARHSGDYLFPQALVLTTPIPLLASQVMAYSALANHAPWREWDRHSGDEVMAFLGQVARQRFEQRPRERQYLVVAWENLRLMYWISYYGSWDLVAGEGLHGICREIGGSFQVDREQGILRGEGGEPIPLASLDELGPGGRKYHEFHNQSRAHLIVNDSARQAVLMDDLAYNSMMVQMLMAPPDSPAYNGAFRMVYEGFPMVRIYEAL